MKGKKRLAERRSCRNKRRSLSFIIGALLTLLLCTPVFAADSPIEGLKQTDASGTSVTVSFSSKSGARQLELYSAPWGSGDFVLRKSLYVTKERIITPVTVSRRASGNFYNILVVAYDENGKELGREELKKCPAAPARVKEIRQQSLYTYRKMQLGWDRIRTASGYQIETLNTVTHERSCYWTLGPYGTVTMEQDMLYRIRVRGYLDLQVNGQQKRIYGPYHTDYTSQAPRVSFTGVDRHTVRASWNGVAGADGYAVFLSTRQRSGYRRVGVTYEPQWEITGLSPGVRYYVLVRMNKRVDGALHRSPCTYVYPVRIDE